jgi:outer membrane protein
LTCLACLVALPAAPQTLTLDEALRLARENNGVVRAAYLNYLASRAAARSTLSSFYPSVTPTFRYDLTRSDTYTGPFRGLFEGNESTSAVSFDWRLLDNGTRDALYRRSALNRDAAELGARDTLRQTLFGVHTAFYEALRAEELLRVRRSQLERATEIEKQAIAFFETGAGPEKDILQAKADRLNAKASELAALNGVSTSIANLKSAVGVPPSQQLDALAHPEERPIAMLDLTLEEAVRAGLQERPDLAAQRLGVLAQGQSVQLARLDRGLNYSVDVNHTRAFSPGPYDSSALVFQVTVPLYDGARTAENLRAARLSLEADQALMTQAERDAVAEIESAYKEFSQNIERLEASRVALEAAQLNYRAAFESRQEGAGELIQILTAQVSLTTAESNAIEAYYDTLVSQARLMVVLGRPVPGESP